MIKSVTGENVQSHVYSELNFHEGVNVITGDTDSGKSSIIKIIKWIKENRPSGEENKNWDASEEDQMAGEIVTDENTVAIIRSNGKTKYILNNDSENPFEAINKDVPLEITEALNLADYNIQTQFQSYFLLQDSPGEVATIINKLVGLDVIDTLYTNIASDIRTTNTQITLNKSTIKETKESLEQYQNLDEIEKLIISIEKNYREIEEKTGTVDLLKKSVQSLEEIENERENSNFLIKLEKTVNELLKALDNYNTLFVDHASLIYYETSLKDVEEEIETEEAWLELDEPCTTILNNLQKLKNLKNGKDNLTTIQTSLNNIEVQEEKEKRIKEKNTEEYLALLKKENICPISNIIFPKQCLSKIKENL